MMGMKRILSTVKVHIFGTRDKLLGQSTRYYLESFLGNTPPPIDRWPLL